jgi:hypothetical protein
MGYLDLMEVYPDCTLVMMDAKQRKEKGVEK